MPTFYLQTGYTNSSVQEYKSQGTLLLPDERTFIDSIEHERAGVNAECEADSWLEAREILVG